jgi:hypothetical protein
VGTTWKRKKEMKIMPMFSTNLMDMTIISINVKLSPQILCQNCDMLWNMTKYNIFSNFKNMHKHLKCKINKIMVWSKLGSKNYHLTVLFTFFSPIK